MEKNKLRPELRIRIALGDLQKLKEIAAVKRIPVSTYCRSILGEHLETK